VLGAVVSERHPIEEVEGGRTVAYPHHDERHFEVLHRWIDEASAIDDGCVSRHASDCLRVMLLRIFRTHGGRHERADTGTDYEFGKELSKRVGI